VSAVAAGWLANSSSSRARLREPSLCALYRIGSPRASIDTASHSAATLFEATEGEAVTLEGETGGVNIIVWRHMRERQRTALLRSGLLAVAGQWQAHDGSTHLLSSQAPPRRQEQCV
jgi:hypothetical protein